MTSSSKTCRRCLKKFKRESIPGHLTDSQWAVRKVCSVKCRTLMTTVKRDPGSVKLAHVKICAHCGEPFTRRLSNGRLMNKGSWADRSWCKPECHAELHRHEDKQCDSCDNKICRVSPSGVVTGTISWGNVRTCNMCKKRQLHERTRTQTKACETCDGVILRVTRKGATISSPDWDKVARCYTCIDRDKHKPARKVRVRVKRKPKRRVKRKKPGAPRELTRAEKFLKWREAKNKSNK